MKFRCLSAVFCLWTLPSFSQTSATSTELNLGFERVASGQKLPEKWIQWGRDYILSADNREKYEGKTSLLLESPAVMKANTFGSVANSIPATYEGKEIELKGYIKYKDVTNGSVGLMMRIDGALGMLQFDNMQQKNIRGTADWKQYSIKLPYSKKAKIIHVGALITGTGKLWIDNFEILIDGKSLSEAKTKEIPSAELDKEFDNGSKIVFSNLTNFQVKDLAWLGRLWGFLKYYHPSVANGNYNWDYELFRIVPGLMATRSGPEKQEVLSEWLGKFGSLEVGKEEAVFDTNVKMKPNLAWISASVLGEELFTKLSAVKNAHRQEEHYYIGILPNGNPDFKNENPYTEMKYPDAGFRLLSLFRYWNMIEYYFPYKSLIGEDWYGVLNEFIPKFINASNETEYKIATLSLIARVYDTHANIYSDKALDNFFGTKYGPLKITFIEGSATVTDYLDQTLGEKTGLKKGDIIEKINGKSVDEIIQEKLPLTPASNYPTQLRNIARSLLRTNDSLLVIDYKSGNELKKHNLVCFDQRKINIYAREMRKDTCFKLIRPDISYLYPGTIKNAYLPAIAPEILKTKGLVIDMRCYPSDFIVFSLSHYLLPQPVSFAKYSQGSITSPGLFTFTRELKVGDQNKDFYKGKIVIIINEITQSNAEYTTMALRTAPNVTIIGSTTAGADGNTSLIKLPGNVETYISGIGVYYPDGRETQRVGIVPDIEVKPTIKGVAEGRDELMEKALEIIDGK